MKDLLTKYTENGSFNFFPDNEPFKQCNAPSDKSGIYLIYALTNGEEKLVYIGSSGKLLPNGKVSIRKGLGGIRDRLINGRYTYKDNGAKVKLKRSKFWLQLMATEKIDSLKICWFVTHNEHYNDCPLKKDAELRKLHIELHGRLPDWNRI
ncbi:MAG: hypothetical protein V4456_14260 [Bacteroidota bacterium]|jgi:hypothetical protein|uniref:hypothetical protein n=1 Tax=Mucilaginibacter inviolabilis TaxID=2714892 RepID=UPI00140BFFC1|nr:hypothetical protein [Mucilaginibacter inviolabilis]NHA05841.1 hypothetical protein [Mucilaginibacter inviolabilis]